MKGEWEAGEAEGWYRIRDIDTGRVYDASIGSRECAALLVEVHNAALRSAVEAERGGCLMDVVMQLEAQGFQGMAAQIAAEAIRARSEAE